MPDIDTWCPPHRAKKFEHLLKRVAKAAKGRNVHFLYTIGKPQEVVYDTIPKGENRNDGFYFDKIQNVWVRTECAVNIEHSDFSPSGWSALAILEKAEGSNRVLIKKIPDIEENLIDFIPDEWNGDCQHCNVDRKRNSTILVKSPKGEVKQVGTSCLFEYTGIDPQLIASFYAAMECKVKYPTPWSEEAWQAYLEYLGEMGYGGEKNQSYASEWPLMEFIVICHRFFGYKGAYIKGMGNTILNSCALKRGDRYYLAPCPPPINYKVSNTTPQMLPSSEEHYEVASEIITYIKNLKAKTDFEYNLQTVVVGDFVSKKNAGFAAAMWFVWNRAKEHGRLEQVFNPTESEGNHLGVVGERIEFVATITKKVGSMGHFGETTMFVFQTSEGDEVIWWSSSQRKDLPEVGDKVTVKGRVKKHGDFNGKKNTNITRPTILKC